MQIIDIYQVDAFSSRLFSGNPAAVCVLKEWLPVNVMQKIAMENNLSETAFIVRESDEWFIRWFTPETEVDLCGHATLASAFVVLTLLHPENNMVIFRSQKMGNLIVKKKADMLELDFPSDVLTTCLMPETVGTSLGKPPLECYVGRSDYLLLYESEADILNLKPDFSKLANAGERGIIVTAPGTDVDFVSRFFAPKVGINEDPVTGSAHTTLTPFWAARLGKKSMKARQLSARGGYLECTLRGERTLISGHAFLYLKGEIFI